MTCFPIQFETSYLKKCSDNGWRNSLFLLLFKNFMLALNVIGWIYTAYQVTKKCCLKCWWPAIKKRNGSIYSQKNQKSCFTLDTNRCVKYLNLGFTKKCVKKQQT
nr:hypothetical protein [Escherichia coli]